MSAEPAPIIVLSGPSGFGKSTVGQLVAAAFERSAHVPTDILRNFVVKGWVDPWLPEAEHQHEIVGGVLAVASVQFALGGYTTIVDGHLFPRGIEGLAVACAKRSVPLHYVVLRADLATCWARARRRGEGDGRSSQRPSASCTPSSPESVSTSRTSSMPSILPRPSPLVSSRHSGRADSQ